VDKQKAMIMIYLINRTLLIQSNRIMQDCRIQIIDRDGNLIKELSMKNQYVSTFPLMLDDGKYLVRVKSESGKKEKQIFISSK